MSLLGKRHKKKIKWSRKHEDALLGFWNPWGYSKERHDYSKSLNIDILGLGELHNKHDCKEFESKRWIRSEVAEKDKQGNCNDPAAGVAILLSPRMAERVMAQGRVGARIVWVRLKGPICNLFVIVVYIPHKGRTNPSALDTIE